VAVAGDQVVVGSVGRTNIHRRGSLKKREVVANSPVVNKEVDGSDLIAHSLPYAVPVQVVRSPLVNA
jgi:hypothetical protein